MFYTVIALMYINEVSTLAYQVVPYPDSHYVTSGKISKHQWGALITGVGRGCSYHRGMEGAV